jgi:hypothetical protein
MATTKKGRKDSENDNLRNGSIASGFRKITSKSNEWQNDCEFEIVQMKVKVGQLESEVEQLKSRYAEIDIANVMAKLRIVERERDELAGKNAVLSAFLKERECPGDSC